MSVHAGLFVVPIPRVRIDVWRETWKRGAAAAVVPAVDLVALMAALVLLDVGEEGRAYGALALVALLFTGGGRRRIAPTVSDELGPLLARLVAPLVVLGPWLASHESHRLLQVLPLVVGLVILGRTVAYAVLRSSRARGQLVEPTLLVGAGERAAMLAGILRDHPEYGLLPVGFLDDLDDDELPLPILGGLEDLDVVLRRFDVRRVVVAFGQVRDPEIVRVLRSCGAADVDVHYVPRFFELGVTAGRAVDDLWGVPLVQVRRTALGSRARRIKRAFDVVTAGGALLLAAPVCAAIALAVRLSSPGPILFRQQRVGLHGEPIEVVKFRTLRVNDDADTCWSVSDDDRQTGVGRFLRRSSLDELPQLVSVLKGDMSMVGPRPERPFFVEQFSAEVPGYQDRHRLPAGITGWAQVHGLRGDTSISERVRFDNRYIEEWSLGFDLRVILRTFVAVVRDAVGRATGSAPPVPGRELPAAVEREPSRR